MQTNPIVDASNANSVSSWEASRQAPNSSCAACRRSGDAGGGLLLGLAGAAVDHPHVLLKRLANFLSINFCTTSRISLLWPFAASVGPTTRSRRKFPNSYMDTGIPGTLRLAGSPPHRCPRPKQPVRSAEAAASVGRLATSPLLLWRNL